MKNVEANSVFDVAKYILNQPGHASVARMNWQKLCFYAQSWHSALLKRPLFRGSHQGGPTKGVLPFPFQRESSNCPTSATKAGPIVGSLPAAFVAKVGNTA